MKIALLGFPLDSNYGSSVQRYALVKVLSDMGHEPVHLYTRYTWPVPGRRPLKVLLGRMLKKIKGEPLLLCLKNIMFAEHNYLYGVC